MREPLPIKCGSRIVPIRLSAACFAGRVRRTNSAGKPLDLLAS